MKRLLTTLAMLAITIGASAQSFTPYKSKVDTGVINKTAAASITRAVIGGLYKDLADSILVRTDTTKLATRAYVGASLDGNNYLGTPTFNSTTKLLTLPRTGLSSVTVTIPYPDTISLSSRVDSSVKYRDTLSLIASVKRLKDTAAAIRSAIGSGGGGSSSDSATFSTNYRRDTALSNVRTQVAALNPSYFNVLTYGADPTGVANSTTAIHAAQAAAALVNGTVYFPHGDYKAAQLLWNVRTNWLGESEKGVTITSLNDLPLITKSDSATLTAVTAYSNFQNFTLVQANGSHVALDLQGLYWSTVSNVHISGFDTAIKNQGTLTATFRDIRIDGAVVGIYNVHKNLGGDIAANLLRFDRVIVSASLWCIFVDHGSMIYVDNCDFESTGAPSLPATSGCIHLEHAGYTGEGTGLHVNNTWFEVNSGTLIDLQAADYPVVNEINFCHFIYTNTRHNCVYAGANNTVNLISSNFKSLAGSSSDASNPHEKDSLNVWADNGAIIQSTGCLSITNIKETNGGRYINLDVDHLLNGDGDGRGAYRDSVIASAPVYYNRLNQSGGTQTPTIGTDNFIITGEYSPKSEGILKNDTSAYSLLMTRASTASCALDLSAYTSVAIEFWSYNEPTYGPSIFYGATNSTGSFILTENAAAQFGAIASFGNVGSDFPTFPIIKRPGWYYYVFWVTNKGVTKILRKGADGEMIWNNANTLPNNTNNFTTGGFTSIQYGAKMEEFAVYAGTIPSVTTFRNHYYSRNNH